MSRLPRLAIGGWPHLVVQQALQGQPAFIDNADRELFLATLREQATLHRVAVHAYVLLDDKIELLVTPEAAPGLSKLMQSLGRSYVAAFNRRHGRRGTLWEGRFRATVLDPDKFFVDCMRHVESQPLLRGQAAAVDFEWSSAVHHLGRRRSPLVSEHAAFWRLGNTPFEREAHYLRLLEQPLTAAVTAAIDGAVNKGWVLGDAKFMAALKAQTPRRLQPLPRGRPPKSAASPRSV